MRRTILIMLLAVCSAALAKVDLTTLPERETVQLTIYNSADLTLVRESRPLTLKEGENSLQFSWENTLIDPTSLEMTPKAHVGEISISELVYPARVRNLGLWKIDSEVSGKVPVEITYLTSGLTWRAFYMGTLTADEKTMRLEGYVVVTNNSGEDYENAQTRLIVGQVHILDEIAALAQRPYPYGSPIPTIEQDKADYAGRVEEEKSLRLGKMPQLGVYFDRLDRKEVKKEGLSEYFLYTIEGTETIPTGWSKRLPSFGVEAVPVTHLYKYDEERFGAAVVRFLSFKNDAEHELGDTPIPGGVLKVYRNVDAEQHLAYTGQSEFKYIPVDEDVELDLGAVRDVVVEPKLMDWRTDSYRFDREGNARGWDEAAVWAMEVRNTRDLPVEIEITRDFGSTYWDIAAEDGVYAKHDASHGRFTFEMPARTSRRIEYTLTTYNGTRREEKNL
jgi:hypothetical protein